MTEYLIVAGADQPASEIPSGFNYGPHTGKYHGDTLTWAEAVAVWHECHLIDDGGFYAIREV